MVEVLVLVEVEGAIGGGAATGMGVGALGLGCAGGAPLPLATPGSAGACISGDGRGIDMGCGDGGCWCCCTGGGGARVTGTGTGAGGGATGTTARGAVLGESMGGAGWSLGLLASPRSGVGPSPARLGVPPAAGGAAANGPRRRVCGARTGNHGAAPLVTFCTESESAYTTRGKGAPRRRAPRSAGGAGGG